MAEEEVNPQSQDVTEVQSDKPKANLESEELEQKDQEQENAEEKETSPEEKEPEVVEDSEIIKEKEPEVVEDSEIIKEKEIEESNKEQNVKDSEETLEQTRDIPTITIDVCEEEPPTEENLEILQDHEKDQSVITPVPGVTDITKDNTEPVEIQPKEDERNEIEVEFLSTALEDVIEENEEEFEDEFDRDEAIECYKTLLSEMERLQGIHSRLQHKIAEYLARKKTEERLDPGRNVTDQEQRFLKCMEALDQLQCESSSLKNEFEIDEQQLRDLRGYKQNQLDKAWSEFKSFVQEKAVLAVHSRTGKKLNTEEVAQYLGMLERKDKEVTHVRLQNIKLQNRIHKQEMLIKQKEQLAEGLHMIDFEQLRINNVDLNEKIEERNEEIHKLKKKVTSTVQVLAHLKEKLQFVQAENSENDALLKEVDLDVAKKRDILTRLKQAKDAIRSENVRLKQQGGLVGHHTLLRDFENKLDMSDSMLVQLQDLQQRHSELTLQCNALRHKIEQTRIQQT